MNEAMQACTSAASSAVGLGGFLAYTLVVVVVSVVVYRKTLKNHPEKIAVLAAAAKKAGEAVDKL